LDVEYRYLLEEKNVQGKKLDSLDEVAKERDDVLKHLRKLYAKRNKAYEERDKAKAQKDVASRKKEKREIARRNFKKSLVRSTHDNRRLGRRIEDMKKRYEKMIISKEKQFHEIETLQKKLEKIEKHTEEGRVKKDIDQFKEDNEMIRGKIENYGEALVERQNDEIGHAEDVEHLQEKYVERQSKLSASLYRNQKLKQRLRYLP